MPILIDWKGADDYLPVDAETFSKIDKNAFSWFKIFVAAGYSKDAEVETKIIDSAGNPQPVKLRIIKVDEVDQ